MSEVSHLDNEALMRLLQLFEARKRRKQQAVLSCVHRRAFAKTKNPGDMKLVQDEASQP